ncbi:MAG: hypothetical protein LBU34_09685 [Planctomycetaceae bacterium]|jgi:hypothetical protein|nr:hypothetical protein [Planctomycetaceae bacterium]
MKKYIYLFGAGILVNICLLVLLHPVCWNYVLKELDKRIDRETWKKLDIGSGSGKQEWEHQIDLPKYLYGTTRRKPADKP